MKPETHHPNISPQRQRGLSGHPFFLGDQRHTQKFQCLMSVASDGQMTLTVTIETDVPEAWLSLPREEQVLWGLAWDRRAPAALLCASPRKFCLPDVTSLV